MYFLLYFLSNTFIFINLLLDLFNYVDVVIVDNIDMPLTIELQSRFTANNLHWYVICMFILII